MTLFQPHRGSASSTAAPQAGHGNASSTGAPQAGHGNASSTGAPQAGRGNASGYEAVRASRDFWTIRRRFGSFVVPACTLAIVWYFLFVIIAVFAPDFMRVSVFGDIKVGLCFGLLEFASTFAIAATYRRWAQRRLDPLADRLRHRLEEGRGR
jgi:uncharacterized membrane protein (DUF485 family)